MLYIENSPLITIVISLLNREDQAANILHFFFLDIFYDIKNRILSKMSQ